ncbi:hypothetical protein GY45DRAFT_141996 [Cubamyces sp. BRFM 1775]|nr:hypothetical protein GY45DRAFT_141996 [Cubamyces sp. BRFM 1775]
MNLGASRLNVPVLPCQLSARAPGHTFLLLILCGRTSPRFRWGVRAIRGSVSPETSWLGCKPGTSTLYVLLMSPKRYSS